MGARENLQKLADRKVQEIENLGRQIEMAKSYLQAIQDAIRSLPRDTASIGGTANERSGELRSGTVLAKTKDVIQMNGAPMHVNEILKALGMEITKASRVSLVGSLGSYVRKGKVFTRPAPNMFGLAGMNSPDPPLVEQSPQLPEEFGSVADK